jgi:hypothetical protein
MEFVMISKNEPLTEREQLVEEFIRLLKATRQNIGRTNKIRNPKKMAAHFKKRDALIKGLRKTCGKLEKL